MNTWLRVMSPTPLSWCHHTSQRHGAEREELCTKRPVLHHPMCTMLKKQTTVGPRDGQRLQVLVTKTGDLRPTWWKDPPPTVVASLGHQLDDTWNQLKAQQLGMQVPHSDRIIGGGKAP